MKEKLFKCGLILVLFSLVIAPLGYSARAQEPTLEEEIEASVIKGLTWLAANQNQDGSWGWECDSIAYTAMVVLKFETRAIELKLDPLGEEYEYHELVEAGLNYIMGFKQTMQIDPQPAGNPDSDGDGIGVYFDMCGWHQVYSTGISMMALAASGHPEIYGDDLQDAVDYMAWAQADDNCDLHRGGWRYWGNECSSDNSNSGYVTLGLGFAAAPPPWGFGIETPQFVKNELSLWADVIQDDVNGDPDDGGSWYEPYWSWVNILKTGNLIYEFGLVGDGPDTQRVMDAVDYIERHWFDPGGGDVGWKDHRQAMFTMMKGLSALGIEQIDLDGDGVPEYDWFAEVAQHLIDTQNLDGSWPGDPWAGPIMSTAWALLTLEKGIHKFEIPVPVDIKPGSCPNPINLKNTGVLPVAIVGTADFDVTQVDPVTVRLVYQDQEVAPLRWAYGDVATPYEPYLGKELDAYACHTLRADGMLDLTLKFDSQAVAGMLAGAANGEVLILTLTGNLTEEHGGTPIHGEDVVKIIKKN